MSNREPEPAAAILGLSRQALLVLAFVAFALIALAIGAGLNATGRQHA